MLHLIFQTPIEKAVLQRMEAGDSVVFLHNAIFRVLRNGNFAEDLIPLLPTMQFYILADELNIRGIEPERVLSGIEIIDYEGLVKLVVAHSLIQTWN
jgi:tRNA 2-thiouridine synthesizing protein B